MPASPNLRAALLDALLAPSQAFAALRQRPAWGWAAIAVIVAASIASIYTLYSGMTPDWIVDQQIVSAGDMSEQNRAANRAMMLDVAPYTGHIAALMTVIMIPLAAVVFGFVYFVGERLLSRERNRFGLWFAAASFCMLPLAVSALGLIVLVLARGGGNLPIDLGNYASLNYLVFGIPPGEKGYSLANSFNLFYLWNIFIIAVAGRDWSGMGWGKAVFFGALPTLLIFVPWTIVTLAQG